MLPKTENIEFIQTADNFVNGGCGHPYFGKSNGNKIFEEELKRYNINYRPEKTFKGCKDKNLLKFDFYLKDLNEVVEIDGEQHVRAIGFFGGEKGLKDRVKKDAIKNKYCEDNKIKITRIPYVTNKLEIYCFWYIKINADWPLKNQA